MWCCDAAHAHCSLLLCCCALCTVQSNASKLAAGTPKPNNSKMHFPATWSCTGVKQASKTVAVRKQNQKANHLSNTKQAQNERQQKTKKTLTRFAQQKSNRNVEKYKGNKRTNLQIYKLLSHAYCLSFLQDMWWKSHTWNFSLSWGARSESWKHSNKFHMQS